MQKFKKRINKKLGELLIERGVIDHKQLEKALESQHQKGGLIGEVIVSLGFAKEEDIVYILSLQYGFPFIPLESYDIDKDVLKLVSKQVALQYCLIPIDKIGDTLSIVMSNPLNVRAIEDIEYMAKCKTQVFVTTSSDIRSAIDKFYK